MFAVLETGGKQYLVKEGGTIKVEKLEIKEGEEVKIDKILYHSNGLSRLSSVTIIAKVLKQLSEERVLIFKKKRRKNYRRKRGHKQCMTLLQIDKISAQEQE